ncbi:MAG TPA: sugar ABC transporter ATP-binding protein, partial [Phycisphaerales bacterium]|nr:sugar ABC transporter ATP-binding protein [Phycisphaerales bacterium]
MIVGTGNGRFGRAGMYLALGLCALVALLPVLYMVSISLQPAEQAMSDSGMLLPASPGSAARDGAANYGSVLGDGTVDFPLYFRNTLVIALLSVAGVVVSSVLVAYGFARVPWRGRGACFLVLLATMMIPFPVVMVPLFVIFRSLGWIGTFMPLWVPAWFGSAFSIFLLRQFYLTIPRELDEAARIDGCGHLGILLRILVPLSLPAILVVALLHFMYVWNDFLGPLVFLTHRDQYTLALGLELYMSRLGTTPWNLLMAASTIMVVPVLLLFLLAQRSFIEG